MKKIDLIGQKFGRLTVIKEAPRKEYKSGQTHTQYFCRCECGKTTVVLSNNLRTGHTKSCGCVRKETTKERSEKHGMSYSRIYRIYRAMLQRCLNKNNHKFDDYGGRGISVCQQWADSFDSFYKWAMANGYDEHLTIDRINNDAGYCPENCRWATMKVQNNNRRKRRIREV